MPPECFSKGGYELKGMDVWALGVSLYCLATSRLPFDGNSFDEIEKAISTKEPEYDYLSCEIVELMKALMEKDP